MDNRSTEGMDCPNCGVYNPAGRAVCWRCDRELPKPKEQKRRKPFWSGQSWVYILMAVLILFSLLQLCGLPSVPGGDESGSLRFFFCEADSLVNLPLVM